MRKFRLMLIVTSISIICILCSGLVSALNPDEASVTLFWSSQTVYQGDVASVRINFQSNYAEQLRIYRIGLHFDWMPPNEFFTSDFSDNPVTIPGHGTHIFDDITIQIPLNVSTGSHSYYVGIDGFEGLMSSSSFSWDSPSSMITVNAGNQKGYNEYMSQVENKLNEALDANYKSAEARSLVQQAQSEFINAQSLVYEGNWEEALEILQNASYYLDQADAAEQASGEQTEWLQNLLFYFAIIAIPVIIAISVIVVVVRKKRKQISSVADQSLETSEEQI